MAPLLSQLAVRAAQREPEATAIRCDRQSLSYRELAERAHGLARVLTTLGLRRSDRVAVLLGKGLKVPVAFHGVLAAGGTLQPIDTKSPVDQMVKMLRATDCRFVVTEPARASVVERLVKQCPTVRGVVGCETPSVVAASWTTVEEERRDQPPEVPISDLDPSYVLHTSGSTGEPKLIRHTHRSAMSFLEWAVDEFGVCPGDRLSNHSSHHTCFATFDYYAAALAGATTVILTPAMLIMPASLSSLLEQEGVSIWYSVPTALVQLALRGDLENRVLERLRWILFAGENFPHKHLSRLREQIPHARFSHLYGSTEVNVCTYYHLPASMEIPRPLPIGKPCSTTRTLVVDDRLEEVSREATGELLVRGSTVMSGYWGEPDRNREALIEIPAAGELDEVYFRTGDRVSLDGDGNLSFVARSDSQIKIRGHRVEIEEVEAALHSLADVVEAVVFPLADGEGSSALEAGVVVTAAVSDRDHAVLAADLKNELRRLLVAVAIPRRIHFFRSLPRTATGKLDRVETKARSMHEAPGAENRDQQIGEQGGG